MCVIGVANTKCLGDFVEAVLPSRRMAGIYDENQRLRQYQQGEIVRCPFCNYTNIAESASGAHPCVACQEAFCWTCRAPYHPGFLCEDAPKNKKDYLVEAQRLKLALLAHELAEERANNPGVIYCSRCIVRNPSEYTPAFVRDNGCNVLTCTECKEQYCAVCRLSQTDNGTVDLHQHIGCDVKRPEDCVKPECSHCPWSGDRAWEEAAAALDPLDAFAADPMDAFAAPLAVAPEAAAVPDAPAPQGLGGVPPLLDPAALIIYAIPDAPAPPCLGVVSPLLDPATPLDIADEMYTDTMMCNDAPDSPDTLAQEVHSPESQQFSTPPRTTRTINTSPLKNVFV
jgi:hypothetical protein